MPKPPKSNPSYRLHKRSGQAVVTLDGRDFYLGAHGSPQSRAEYDRLIGEWLTNGRRLLTGKNGSAGLCVNELSRRYLLHAESYYRKPSGKPTSQINTLIQALRPLRTLYGKSLASDFRPLALKSVRELMVQRMDWSRDYVNRQVGRIKAMYKWGVENELVEVEVYQALATVRGLAKGRCAARETDKVKPVHQSYIDAVEPFVSRQVWAMIRLQLLTGMRPGEVIIMRSGDIDTQGEVWEYRPAEHKTEHHGHKREIKIGPEAQAIVKGYLKPELMTYLFSPAEAAAEHRQRRHDHRQTSLGCGNRPGTNRKAHPKRVPSDRYELASYRRAIIRACDQGFPPPDHLQPSVDAQGRRESKRAFEARLTDQEKTELYAWQKAHRWYPQQLRHNAGTEFRRRYGVDVTRALLGHQSPVVTEIYAEIDQAKAEEAMKKSG